MASGTSDSTAYTSAALALLRSQYPDLTAGQLATRLTETAELPQSEKGAKRPDERYGYGAIRPVAALQDDIPKGSKYGPLSVPQAVKDDIEAAAREKESDAMQKESDRQAAILWAITGVIGLLFVAAIVFTVVLIKRRRNKKQGGGPGNYGGPGARAPTRTRPARHPATACPRTSSSPRPHTSSRRTTDTAVASGQLRDDGGMDTAHLQIVRHTHFRDLQVPCLSALRGRYRRTTWFAGSKPMRICRELLTWVLTKKLRQVGFMTRHSTTRPAFSPGVPLLTR